MADSLLLMIGTTKGAFLLRSEDRRRFSIDGPYLSGAAVYAMAYDGRAGRHRIYASASNAWFGTHLHTSDDLGATWVEARQPAIAFPADTGASLNNIWQLSVPEGQPDVVYAGVEPAALFRSTDAGATFELVRGLWDHPHRPQWQPGQGGLCLHTVLPDPADTAKTVVAISAAGVYQTADGGDSWTATNTGIRVDFAPDPHPEFGQCVHKVARDPTDPQRLFAQNHGGLYRSDDGGQTWNDIGTGVPSDFGFPMVVHPREPNTAYCIPLEGPARWTPDGRVAVYRTTDGKSWQPLTTGLPQEHAHLTVLRDGFCADPLSPAGLWFGTRTGQVFGSADEGETWARAAENLPPVVCVKAAAI